MRKTVWLMLMALVLAACSGTAAQKSSGSRAQSETPSATERPTEAPDPTNEPTPAPTEAPDNTFAVGDVITIIEGGDPWAEFTVKKVEQAKVYKDPSGYFDDVPEQKGNVFLAAQVQYKALTNNVDYNPYDFELFVNDEAVDNTTFVTNGPEPRLSSGTLPEGRKASGWIVYEVPAKGKVILSYASNMFSDDAPVFEVVLRAK
jgi:hypothetical protein